MCRKYLRYFVHASYFKWKLYKSNATTASKSKPLREISSYSLSVRSKLIREWVSDYITVNCKTDALGRKLTLILLLTYYNQWGNPHDHLRSTLGQLGYCQCLSGRMSSWLGGNHRRSRELLVLSRVNPSSVIGAADWSIIKILTLCMAKNVD